MPSIDSQITFCPVRDITRSGEFWQRIMGLKLVLDQGTCRIFRTVGDAYLGFCQRDDCLVDSQIILTIVSDDVDLWYERLLKAQVVIDHAPLHNPEYSIYHFFARDPDGYRIEIQKFDDSLWNIASDPSPQHS